MKRSLLVVASILVFLALGSRQAFAHHSVSAVYDATKTVKIEGTVKEFLWRNPHSFVKVEAPDEKGVMQTFVLEWASPTQLAGSHLTSNVLKVGDHIICGGNPGRIVQDHRIRLTSVERPSDGWKWQGQAGDNID
jgi:Family of unknown function (DUF6152)